LSSVSAWAICMVTDQENMEKDGRQAVYRYACDAQSELRLEERAKF